MRTLDSIEITNAVKKLCMDANYYLPCDIKSALEKSRAAEKSHSAKLILDDILKNAEIAKTDNMPICQDTGMAVFKVEIGQNVHISGKNITDAINDGVMQGYRDGYLRKSVVADPLRRTNTNTNTPAIIHYDIVDGDKVRITFAPKGFGSENMGALAMLKPAQGIDGVIDFVLKTVENAGSNPCPPIVVGVGIGGTMEKAACLAKYALMRPIDSRNSDEFYADLEDTLLEKINELGIGPQGLGGSTSALGVNVEVFATHIAGLPVCVNINCHATRHLQIII